MGQSPTDQPPPRPPPRPPSRLRRPRVLVPLAVVLLVLAAAGVWRLSSGGPVPLTRADVDRAVEQGIETARRAQAGQPPDAASAYRAIQPSLVTITTGTDPGTGSALGAGVVINADGAILTALHVVTGGGPIRVRFADGTTASAKVARSQQDSDIAVLAVDRLPQVVVPAVLGGGVQVGDAVFPVGHPLGLQRSLSAGVVSALDRSITTQDGLTLKRLIQFDAAVNPGNSGGPLLDRFGQVVGVVTGLANPAEQSYFVGIGFAVPIATAGGVAGGPSV